MTSADRTTAATAARHPRPKAELPWRDRPLLTLQATAQIVGLSPSGLYKLAAGNRLKLKRLAGRTLVDTSSLIALMDTAEDWAPAARGDRA